MVALGSRPCAFYGIPGEAALVCNICEILDRNPLEVNTISSQFAVVFNEVVRASELTPFGPDKRNDGSFKKWLLKCGFEVGPLFERNRAFVYVPGSQTAELPSAEACATSARRFPRAYRGKHRASAAPCDSWPVQSDAQAQETATTGRPRWEVRQRVAPEIAEATQVSKLVLPALDADAEVAAAASLPAAAAASSHAEDEAENRPSENASCEPSASEDKAFPPAFSPEPVLPPLLTCASEELLERLESWVEVREAFVEESQDSQDDEEFVLVGHDEEDAECCPGGHSQGSEDVDGRWLLEDQAWPSADLGSR
mmetsp:Transcript_48414/g.86988  ORF Transcript_48414/g.86988 Transcript_48414/m.86988 type:complete len:312 (-) Transcript_48414:129-1064(-)